LAIQASTVFPRLVGQFELDRFPRLLLHSGRHGNGFSAMGNIAHLELDDVAAPKFAIDGQIEKGKVCCAQELCGFSSRLPAGGSRHVNTKGFCG